MKGIYFCVGQNLSDESSGIGKKINSQIDALRNSGYDMDVLDIENANNLIDKLFFWSGLISTPYKRRQIEAVKHADIEGADFVYIRKPTTTSALLTVLRDIKERNKKIKVVMELPTYPSSEYIGIKKILNIYSKYAEKRLHRYVDRILTYSRDTNVWGIKAIPTTNCINCKNIKAKSDCDIDSNKINLIAVADFNYWHGYDRTIEGIKKYYSDDKRRDYDVELYLVGGGKELDNYKRIVASEPDISEHVHFCGKLFGSDLDDVFEISHIGLDAMGRHRSGVTYNSSLKGKEYGGRGLPIVSGVETELDYDNEYKYYMRVPADDTPVDIWKVVEFYREVYKKQESPQKVIREIREYTEKNFDYSTGYKTLVGYLRDEV